MTKLSARELARKKIEVVFARSEEKVSLDALSAEDRSFYQELVQGTLRHWRFLEWCVNQHARRAPRDSLLVVMNLSAYQILFLDRIPDFAIFSEAKAMGDFLGLSEPEQKFMHGVLKAIERDKDALLVKRVDAIRNLENGASPESDLDWAVLNARVALLDAMTFVESANKNKAEKVAARARAVRALLEMQSRLSLTGFALPGEKPQAKSTGLQSGIAPHAVVFEGGEALVEDLVAGRVRIQGEASQWSCQIAAERLDAMARASARPLRVLEAACGKGGKFIGTLMAWAGIAAERGENIPSIEWVAVDRSADQLDIFEKDSLPVAKKLWPQVKVSTFEFDWPESGMTPALEGQAFDFIWLDAPCTGFGTLAKLPEIMFTRGEQAYESAQELAVLQKRLCDRSLGLLKSGGSYFYSVCTLTRPETLDIAAYLAAKLDREPLRKESLWPGASPAPHAEGFFAVLF